MQISSFPIAHFRRKQYILGLVPCPWPRLFELPRTLQWKSPIRRRQKKQNPLAQVLGERAGGPGVVTSNRKTIHFSSFLRRASGSPFQAQTCVLIPAIRTASARFDSRVAAFENKPIVADYIFEKREQAIRPASTLTIQELDTYNSLFQIIFSPIPLPSLCSSLLVSRLPILFPLLILLLHSPSSPAPPRPYLHL